MSIVSIQKKKHKNNSNISSRISVVFVCDNCGAIVLGQARFARTKLQFCNKQCANESQSTGVLRDMYEMRCIEKFGVASTFASKKIQEKSKKTFNKRYDVDNPAQLRLKRGTYVSPFSKTTVQEKCKKTCQQRYGVDNYAKTQEWKQKIEKTCNERYNSSFYTQTAVFQSQINQADMRRKQHKTLKENGYSFNSSNAEIQFEARLKSIFSNVNSSVLVNGGLWPIDYHIVELNVYVQFDGDYWHGLDRQIDEIRKLNNLRDASILKKINTDARQNEWFMTNNFRLFRISESKAKSVSDEELMCLILSLSDGDVVCHY